jgi:hypothetical protein
VLCEERHLLQEDDHEHEQHHPDRQAHENELLIERVNYFVSRQWRSRAMLPISCLFD